MAESETSSFFSVRIFKNPPNSFRSPLSWTLIGLGPLCVRRAHGSEVSHGG